MWSPLINAIKQSVPRSILKHFEYRQIMEEARQLSQDGKLQEALKLLLPIVTEQPTNVQLRFQVAVLQQKLALPIDLPPLKSPLIKFQEKPVLPEKISKEIRNALNKVYQLLELDDTDSLKEAWRTIENLDNKYPYPILGDTCRILGGKILARLFDKQDYDDALAAKAQIESKLMLDPNIVSVGIEKDPMGTYRICIGVLSLESYQKGPHLKSDCIQLETTDATHKKKTVPVRFIETTIPVALSSISPSILPASTQSSRILENDNSSDKSGPSSEPSPSEASSRLLFNETPASLDPHTSSNRFKFAMGAGISFFALGLAYYATSEQSGTVTSTNNDSQCSAPFTTPEGFTRLVENLTPEKQKSINKQYKEAETRSRGFSAY